MSKKKADKPELTPKEKELCRLLNKIAINNVFKRELDKRTKERQEPEIDNIPNKP